ncbi:MAG: tetratricopeptide repeat protein [Cyanobacteria bacterium SZAS LIN-5]|nr:tetratricopeptide repeat protein [Cyanobacteria bacterium SZAS LIN-5]
MTKNWLFITLFTQALALLGLAADASNVNLDEANKAYDQALYGTTLKLVQKISDKNYEASLLEAKTREVTDCYSSVLFNRTAALAPDKSTAAMWRGYALFVSRKYIPAQTELETAIRLNPKNALAHAFLGCCYCYMDELDKGMAEIETAKKIDPTPDAYDLWTAVGYVGAGESKKAEVFYNKVVAKNPNSARVFIMRADFLDEAGKFPASKADYDHAIKLSPRSQYAHFRRARLLSEKKLYAQAIPDAIKGAELEKIADFGKKSMRLLALAYEKTGQTQKAIEVWKPYLADCEHARRLSGSDHLALFSLIEDCEKVHDYKSAKTYVDWVCRIDSRSTEAVAKRARIAFELNDYNSALRDYTMLISSDPTNAQWFVERAKVYEKLGKPDLAKTDLGRSKALAEE